MDNVRSKENNTTNSPSIHQAIKQAGAGHSVQYVHTPPPEKAKRHARLTRHAFQYNSPESEGN